MLIVGTRTPSDYAPHTASSLRAFTSVRECDRNVLEWDVRIRVSRVARSPSRGRADGSPDRWPCAAAGVVIDEPRSGIIAVGSGWYATSSQIASRTPVNHPQPVSRGALPSTRPFWGSVSPSNGRASDRRRRLRSPQRFTWHLHRRLVQTFSDFFANFCGSSQRNVVSQARTQVHWQRGGTTRSR